MVQLLSIKARGHGKTTELIEKSARNNVPIIANSPELVKYWAAEMGVNIPEPIRAANCAEVIKDRKIERVYIDDVDHVLNRLIGAKVDACTVSVDDRPTQMFNRDDYIDEVLTKLSEALWRRSNI